MAVIHHHVCYATMPVRAALLPGLVHSSLNCAVLLTRYIFWVDCCDPPHIGRIGMDGRGQTVIIDTEIYSPTALTIDYTNKRLYWADDNHILFATMDGAQRRKGETKVSLG